MPSSAALLEVSALTKRFGGLTALSEVDFRLHEGEILGLIGPNGAGKTTTFSLIAGALAPSSGSIRFAGEQMVGLAPHAIAARGVLRTFQHNRPFAGMPVLDNVLVGAHTRFRQGLWRIFSGSAAREEQEGRQRAEALIDFVGLGEARNADVGTLSFGQGRLLEIARALAGEPRLILLDEPAAGLTPAECERLAEIIRGIAARGIAVLLIEHDMRFLLPLAHRIAVLNFGRKIADGLPEEIRGDRAVRDAYLGEHAARR
ncbi:MAG TPA: ABC transporter ATP-binding protein [Burkholderiales bacterium]|jgi:ABC-type branched-subunit amino acid transport system ATPase component|nr:ABC transporter ATP-binding protein [Burkholderiales bacterium]